MKARTRQLNDVTYKLCNDEETRTPWIQLRIECITRGHQKRWESPNFSNPFSSYIITNPLYHPHIPANPGKESIRPKTSPTHRLPETGHCLQSSTCCQPRVNASTKRVNAIGPHFLQNPALRVSNELLNQESATVSHLLYPLASLYTKST